MFKRLAPIMCVVLVLFIVVALGSCDGGARLNAPPPAPSGQQSQSFAYAPQDGAPASGDDSLIVQNEISDVSVQPAQDRIVLKSASLSLVVDAAADMLADITSMAEGMGGWVVTSNSYEATTSSGEEVTRASITIRVPAERFNETLDSIKGSAVSVESENVTGQDVTQQYVDLTSRLHNLEAAETQLQAIMETARRTEDVLTVHNELVRVRGEIEVIRGQINYYEESAAFSSITLDLIPSALKTPIQIVGWSPEGTARNALNALLNVLRFIVDAAITIVVLVAPLVLLVGIPGWLLYRTGRRRGWLRSKPVTPEIP
jgi:hypothetical protein